MEVRLLATPSLRRNARPSTRPQSWTSKYRKEYLSDQNKVKITTIVDK